MADVPLYQRLLGDDFLALDAAVRDLHSLRGHQRLRGRCTIVGAERRGGRWLAALLGLPAPAKESAFAFELSADRDGETWTRHFPHRAMRSRLHEQGPSILGERLGPARLSFALDVHEGSLSMRLLGVRILGMPWPRRWLPTVWAREHGVGEQFHFDVGARLGALGLLVAYRGQLDMASAGQFE